MHRHGLLVVMRALADHLAKVDREKGRDSSAGQNV